jgi:DNA-directed RNA polymerase
LLDKELAKKVNLTPQTNSDNVQDIYSEILVDINKAINNYGILNPDFSSLAYVKLTRDILKVSIMTKVYNITTYGIAAQLENKLQTIYVASDSLSSLGHWVIGSLGHWEEVQRLNSHLAILEE